MTLSRVLAVVVAVVAALVVATATGQGGAGPSPAATASADRTTALAVLRAWDRRRAAAWRRGDPGALRALYVVRSAAGRADRAALAAYAARGVRVTGMRMQVAAAEVRSETGDRIVLVVVDRLVGATAVGHGRRLPLPEDRWSRRRIRLVRTGESWRVAEVTDQPRPAASTESTSGSANS